jgi:hypothetical protein
MFCVVANEECTFKLFPKQGIIPALASMYPVKITFSPDSPINFYRRMFILVSDALPLFMDCMGSGYIRAKGEIKEQRPWPLRHAHIQAYRNRNNKDTRKKTNGGFFGWFNKKNENQNITESNESIIYLDPIKNSTVWGSVYLPPYKSSQEICDRIEEISKSLQNNGISPSLVFKIAVLSHSSATQKRFLNRQLILEHRK